MWPHQVEGVASEEECLLRLAGAQRVSCSPELPQLVKREAIIVLTELQLELGRVVDSWEGLKRLSYFNAIGQFNCPEVRSAAVVRESRGG